MSGQTVLRTVGQADHCWTASAVSVTLISSFAVIKSIGFFGFSKLPVERALLQLPALPEALLTEYTGTCQALTSSLGSTFHSPPPTPLFFFFKISETQKRLCTKDSLLHPETHTSPEELKYSMQWWRLITIQCRSQENTLEFFVGLFSPLFISTFLFVCFYWGFRRFWCFGFFFSFFMLGKKGPWSAYPVRCGEFSLMCAEVQWQTLTTWIR